MIRVIKDWAIDGNTAGGYVVGKIRLDGKGKEYIADTKHPSTLKQAFELILKSEQIDLVMKNNLTVSQAIIEFEKLNNQMSDLFNKSIKETL